MLPVSCGYITLHSIQLKIKSIRKIRQLVNNYCTYLYTTTLHHLLSLLGPKCYLIMNQFRDTRAPALSSYKFTGADNMELPNLY